jgi:murein DD-endopeptidase MepM/ murein hydrolase activator NlpD
MWKTVFMALVFALMAVTGCKSTNLNGLGIGGGRDFLLPFESGKYWILSQGYGTDPNYSGTHKDYGFLYGNDTYALDFTRGGCGAYGQPVLPIMDGTVLQLGPVGTSGDQGYGNNILVAHDDGYVSRYGHLSEIYVSEGDHVSQTDAIGAVGDTGFCLGTACPDHPGTHLHLAVYQNEEATETLPLSGTYMSVGCWYNREGKEDCGSDPGTYASEEDYSGSSHNDNEDDYNNSDDNSDNGYDFNVSYAGVSPEHGTADQTEFIWLAAVEADSEPSATLYIYNEEDDQTYDFEMEMTKGDSPYVFTYQKSLRDPADYEYWITVDYKDTDTTVYGDVEVNHEEDDLPTLGSFSLSPRNGEANETEFEFRTTVYSDDEPDVTLKILNPNDGVLYDFEMDVDDHGDHFKAEYEKTLRDPDTYVYFMEAENNDTVNNGIILTVDVD